MAVSVFDPHAGKRGDVIQEIHQVASSHRGCKCGSCGSSEYITHKRRSICTYCRTPESTGSFEAKPSAVDREWKMLRHKMYMEALSSMYGLRASGTGG